MLASAPALAAEPIRVRIIAFNDFHGHLEPGENAVTVPLEGEGRSVSLRSGGAAYLAARIGELRAGQRHSVVVSSGDLIGAAPLVSGLFHDEPTIEVMNALGVDVNALGNHEFDRGLAELQRMVRGGCAAAAEGQRRSCAGPTGRYDGARFPFIAANVRDREGRRPFAPAWVREFDGVRIGFIGAVTRSTPGIVRPDGVAGLQFEPEAEAINAAAAELRAQGVQALVAVIHEGGDAEGGINGCDNPRGAIFDIERALDPAIDLVLSAHTHRAYNCRIGGRTVIQAASFGRLLSIVDLALDPATGDVDRVATVAHNVPVPNGLDAAVVDESTRAAFPAPAPDPRVAAIVEHYRALAAPLADRPVGRLAGAFDRGASAGGDHALGRLIADAHLAAQPRADVAFTNPGGIRTDLRPRDGGAVTYADLFAVQPFGNTLVTMTLTGAQLRELLEQQWNANGRVRMLQPSRGLAYTWDAARPVGARIVASSLQLNGRPIDPGRGYRVTVNNFLAEGGDGFRILRQGTDRVGGPLDVEALTEFIRVRSTERPLQPDRMARIARLGNTRSPAAPVR
jgi:5'-nucleotidase